MTIKQQVLIDELKKHDSYRDKVTVYTGLINGPDKMFHIPVDDNEHIIILVFDGKNAKYKKP